ncbi:MAG: glycosyltransferase [Pararhodobacter sp.]|nr:glycosyltransferase [Pararhodobacter sp.]
MSFVQSADLLEFNLALARRRWRRARAGQPPKVLACGWEMAHNAAGRVRNLADLWRPLAETEIIGATFPRWGNELWPPIRDTTLPCHLIHVDDEAAFPRQALTHVLAHPCDIVHLSKPRLPNILFGLLYKLVWDARVILDIDDEELGAVRAEAPLALDTLLTQHGGQPRWENLAGQDWTRVAVGQWGIFDAVTVSNPALQARYGGVVIPHARPAATFDPSPERRRASRDRFGIPQDKTVVLFFGTPRRHKGLLETAGAIAALGRDDLCYVIVGDFPDPKLRQELVQTDGVDIRFLPDQPYDRIADIVALGDICILLQRDNSLLASFQLPAKLVDTLAMGLLVIAQPTPALMPVIKAGAVAEAFRDTLPATLAYWLDHPDIMQATRARGRAFFLEHLSSEANTGTLSALLAETPALPAPGVLLARPEQRRLFEGLGGWHMFQIPAPLPAPVAPATALPEPAAGNPAGHAAKPASQDARLVVYSVLVGDYETLKEPETLDPAARYILFTDQPDLKSDKWEVVPLDTKGLSPRRASRLPKLLPHRYLPDHDISIYIDASLTIIEPDIATMARDALQDHDIAGYAHFERNCVFDEIEECLSLGKVEKTRAKAFRDRLQKEQFPRQWGLLENACLVRRNSPVMRRINDLWFNEYINGPERDQFSLMYVLWRAEVPHAVIGNARSFRKSPHMRWTKHHGATACAAQPDPGSVAKQFDFLAKLQTAALVKTVTSVCDKLQSGRQADGFPAVSTRLMREAAEAITWLEMQGSDDAQKCRNLLAHTLFPQAAPFARSNRFRLAYIPNAAMPTQAANNVHVMKMCAALAESGMDVTLYAERAADYGEGTERDLQEHFGLQTGFPIVLRDKDNRGRENLLYRLVRQAIADGCTHIYTRSLEVALYAALADVPVIFEEHKIKGEAEFAYQSLVARSPALERIVVISQPLKRLQAAIQRGLENKVSVLHDAADAMRDTPPPFDLGSQDQPGRNIGYVGHLYPGKGAELCWELARRMPGVTFHMLGGTAKDIASWQAQSQDLHNLVFHGHRPPAEVPGFIAAVDICIAPFLRDVKVSGGRYNVADFFSPLKIFEYMAQGKPIITSDLPVLREVLTPDETALMCDPDRPESFVEALNRLIAQPDLGQRLGRAAKTRLEADFTWAARARAVRTLFDAAKPRIEPPAAALPRPAPTGGPKPLMRWYYGGQKQEGWAYGINARRLSARIPSLDHIAPGALQDADRPLDIALAFDILIMQGEKFKNGQANKKILRIGGPNPLKVFSGGNMALLRAALAQADSLIALSPQLRDELSMLHPSVHFIPNGIDTTAIRPDMRQRAPDGPFTVGMSASMSKEFQRHTKGYYFATEACAAAGAELMVIGRGTRQIPHDRLLPDFWSQIDVLLHPVGAGKEASSNVIMEALAWGVPVITTRHAGFHGVALEHGCEGLIMRRTVADFAEAIRALRTDPGLCNILSTGGRAFVERHHALDVVARAYEDVIWQCLDRAT